MTKLSLFCVCPQDPVKRELAEELFSYTDTFTKSVFSTFKGEGDDEAGEKFSSPYVVIMNDRECNLITLKILAAAAFDEIENALSKFKDGPFFLGQLSLVS